MLSNPPGLVSHRWLVKWNTSVWPIIYAGKEIWVSFKEEVRVFIFFLSLFPSSFILSFFPSSIFFFLSPFRFRPIHSLFFSYFFPSLFSSLFLSFLNSSPLCIFFLSLSLVLSLSISSILYFSLSPIRSSNISSILTFYFHLSFYLSPLSFFILVFLLEYACQSTVYNNVPKLQIWWCDYRSTQKKSIKIYWPPSGVSEMWK